ncbi:MAG: Holliday junction resolvase RecU [Bacilli bacterium]|nr:Holliday junction resolvase RecU [Bacilli bacterium]
MINYPNKKTTFVEKKITHSNRGMSFENMINDTNEYYLAHNIAVIHKKPIPIQIVKVDYPSRSGAVIKEAYYKVPSTTDYNGIYHGHYIDFEAKETTSTSSFPLSNIHPHQIEHLSKIEEHGGISFILIFLKKLDQVYLLETKYLLSFVMRSKVGRKSISFAEIQEFGYLIKESYSPRIDYLKIIDEIIKKG